MKSHINPLGISLFFVYLAFYVGFVLLTAFWPNAMNAKVYGDVNLAVFYGFGLIIAAFVLALIYGLFGKTTGSADAEEEAGQ